MAKQTDIANLTLRLLTEMRDELRGDLLDLKLRMTSLERGQALITQELGRIREDMAVQSSRMDRFDQRLGRIERRLELVGSLRLGSSFLPGASGRDCCTSKLGSGRGAEP